MSSAMQLRVSLTVDNFEKAVSFYRDVLGLPLVSDWSTLKGKCVALSVEKATIEIIDHAQADYIDDVEIGRRVSGRVRLAFQFPDVQAAVDKAEDAGVELVHDPVETPWKDVNARVLSPDGMQMTFFQSPSDIK